MAEYRKELLGDIKPFRFPTLYDRAHHAGEERATELLPYETSRLMSLCERERISPFVVFQTAWALVLRRYIPADFICFIYLISDDDSTAIRNLETTSQLSGLLICRAQLIEDSIINQLRQMQAKFDCGMLWKVQSSAEINQTLNDQLFNTAISVNQQSRLASLTQYSPLSGKSETTKHDLVMDITHLRDQITIVLKYDTSILSDSQAGNVVNTFVTALSEIIANPGQDIEQLDPLSELDRKQIWGWVSSMQEKTDACVHSLIEDRARLHPDTPAICSWDGNMSYKELDMLSTQLAHHLVYLGVGLEVMVPLYFEKSMWMIVAMLAVMKAGGVFVPLDSSCPIGRLESIIIQVRANIVLSSAQHKHLLSSLVDKVVVIGESALAQLPARSGIPCTSVCPSNAVYVVFTSGSTGTPKGCVIEHTAYCSSALGQGKTLHMGSRSRVFQFASYSFDACLVEILTTLIFGGCICTPSEDERINNITQVMNRMDVNWASFAPSVVRLIEPKNVTRLKTLVLVGEAASQKDVDKWIDRVQLFNGYGPTECAVGCVYQELTKEKFDARCIGRGVGANCWIVDISNVNRLNPIGAVGELLIEGPCLGRGYLNDKTKTDAAFIRDPAWIPDDGTGRRPRLYRTGDLVRYNLDGTINFVGRKDSQVKIRGQRVELGEIEYHLTADPVVKSAIVVVRDSESRNRQLVAVVALYEIGMALEAGRGNEIRVVSGFWKGEAAAKVSEIRKNLTHKLPSYMIPATWVVVEDIPLLSSGKLHRVKTTTWILNMGEEEFRAHSEISDEEAQSDPGNALEEQLQRIWGQVLNIPLYRVRMDRSFLNLGGDSISAIAVMARCRAVNMVVTAQDILQCKAIPQLALNLRATRDFIYITESETEDQLDTPFALSPIQQFYFDLIHNDDDYFNQSFLLQLTKKISTENIALSIQAIIEQHSMLRARFRRESTGRWTQRITSEVLGSYQLRCHDSLNVEGIASTVMRSQASLNIRNGPLFAADLFIDGDKQILFLTAHHLVIDLVSWRIVLSDLEEFLRYGTLSAPKPLPFQAWSRAQAKHCLQHINPSNTLPFDIGEPDYDFWGMRQRPNRFKDTMTERFTMEREMTAKLFGICNNALRTEPIELLLSAVIHSFSRTFPERRAPAVFNEGHGREPWHPSINLSRTVGWFTTLYPLWVCVDDREDIVKTIRHTKDQRRRIPNNGWSYFTSRFLHPEGSKAFVKHSEMEVLFNYEGIYQQLERNDTLFRQLPWATSQILGDCGGHVRRLTLLEITATVKQGILHFCFEYNCHMNHTDRIKHWVRECESTLREAVVQLVQRSIEYTLSDFPLLPLSYTALAKFVNTTLPGIGILKVEEIEDAYLCSSSQQGMLVSQAKQPTLYHMQIIREAIPVEGQGSADVQRFGVAWQKVVDRHPILRTVFVENMDDDGNFGQVVLKKITAAVRYVQWDYEDGDENGLAQALSDRSFDATGKYRPPHRLTICTTSGGRILLNLEISHTIMDGISLSLIFRDLSLAYDNILPWGPGPLYRNFISYIQGQDATNGIEYWRQYVKNVVPCYFPVLDQGSDRQTGSGTIDVLLDAFRLRTFCQQYGVSISNVLRTAWALVLSSYLGEDEVCFGCIGSGREIPIPEVQDAVGPYISMLICRVGFNPTESISKVLHRVHNDFLSSLPHQHACFLAEIQHELRMCGKPLFNSGISVQKWQTESSKSSIFKFRDIKWEDPSEYDIVVNAIESKETISLTLRYLKRGMSEEYVSNVARTYATALREIISNPEQDIKQFRLFSEWDQTQIWKKNGTIPDEMDAYVAEDQVWSCPGSAAARFLSAGVKRAPSISVEVENRLQQIWAKVLNVQASNIGISDNFFTLGGDSVIAMRLVASARGAGICLSMADVFNHPTLPDLAHLVTTAGGITEVKIQPLKSAETEENFLQDAPLQCATPRTFVDEIEKRVQQIWARVLNVQADNIGIGDNFFKLGGDSFTAMRLVAVARDVGIRLSVADIFGHPTLSDLSLALSVPDRLALPAERHNHLRFSSLNLSDVEEFLEEVVCPQIASKRPNIEDALAATGIQAAMIAFGLSWKRGNIHYFTLDFDGYVNASRLKSACQALISHHPIFRTVFFAHQLHVFQIVLRSVPLEFQRYECESSIEDLSKQLINADKSLDFAPGDRIVRFMFLERGAHSSRLIMKVSHAQYDGLCFPTVIRDLKTAYLGEKIEASPPFSDFIYAITRKDETEAEHFWRTLLKNSSMTTFSHHKTPSYENHIDSLIVRSIPPISLTSQGITFASLAKAAWAFVLAQLSGLSDVVFGHVVSGRNLLLEGIDQIVGPCINVVPVRVRFQPSTVLDLLHLVQNQHLEAIPFETTSFRHIVKQCTGWPLWSRFGSVVQHQNLDEILTSYRFGDVNCNIGAVTAPHDVVDIAILTSLHGMGIDVSLNYSKRVISRSFAEEVLEILCSTILQFSMDVNAQLPSSSSWSTPNPRIPFPSDIGQAKQQLCNNTQTSKVSAAYYQSIVERAWKFVMDVGGDCDPNIPFFDIWGDLFAAAQLSAFYCRGGICITVEEILSHPTMHLQTVLAAQRSGINRINTP